MASWKPFASRAGHRPQPFGLERYRVSRVLFLFLLGNTRGRTIVLSIFHGFLSKFLYQSNTVGYWNLELAKIRCRPVVNTPMLSVMLYRFVMVSASINLSCTLFSVTTTTESPPLNPTLVKLELLIALKQYSRFLLGQGSVGAKKLKAWILNLLFLAKTHPKISPAYEFGINQGLSLKIPKDNRFVIADW